MADARRLHERLNRHADELIESAGREVVRDLQREALSWRYSTGETAERIVLVRGPSTSNRVSRIVRTQTKQSEYREHGTRPHVIRPKRPGYPLRFYWHRVGRVVYRWSVNHPGNRPMPWFFSTIRQSFPRALRSALRR